MLHRPEMNAQPHLPVTTVTNSKTANFIELIAILA